MNLYLTGIMGCGKSSAGQMAADILNAPFVDVDAEIEKLKGMPISEIFNMHGEEYFRQAETDMLRKISKKNGVVVSTGGGVVLREENIDIMKETGKIVWIERSVDLIITCVDASVRPLIAANPEKLNQIYAQRKSLYGKYADAIVQNNGSIEAAAKEIAEQYILLTSTEEEENI